MEMMRRTFSHFHNIIARPSTPTHTPSPHTFSIKNIQTLFSSSHLISRLKGKGKEMSRITEDLLRRRSEHNEGCLSTLREITLHQFDIGKIELVGDLCRHLEILYLQNNLIGKIENLHHLKELKYLSLAVNNIVRIENLEWCESLEKLDLTVNFIEDPLCLENLRENYNLKELFLIGNPCTSKEGFRLFAIETLPQLKRLDGEPVSRTERLRARQEYLSIRQAYVKEAHERGEEVSDELPKELPVKLYVVRPTS
jgi:hypothetical protein